MDEQRPGWWQASDGQWYPPDQHPDPAHRDRYPATPPTVVPAPSPEVAPGAPVAPVAPAAPVAPRVIAPAPKPPGGGRRGLYVAIGALLVVAAAVGGFVVVGGDDESTDDRATATTRADDDDESTTTVADDETTTTTGGGDDGDDDDPPASGATEVSGVSLVLPDGWLSVEVGGGTDGADLFPDDPQAASIVDTAVATLPADAVLFALDPDIGSGTNLNLQVARVPAGGLDEAVAAGREVLGSSPGFTIESDRDIEVDGEDAHTFAFSFADGQSPVQSIVQVVVVLDDQLVVLTMSTLDPARNDASFEEIVASLAAA